MTKIEEIARAILKRRYYDCEPDMYDHSLEGFFASLDPDHMEDALGEALAALQALRKPTEEMADVGRRKNDGSHPHNAEVVFTAMIDHIIQEGKK